MAARAALFGTDGGDEVMKHRNDDDEVSISHRK